MSSPALGSPDTFTLLGPRSPPGVACSLTRRSSWGRLYARVLIIKCLSYILTVVASPESDARPFPALLRAAWRTYGSVVREALSEVGFDDMPRNGAYVVSGIAGSGAPLSGIIEQLGVSRQAGGQLVDSLVASGYLDRSVDPRDRRRLTITLTERGRAAAKVIRSAVDRQNDLLVRRVGAEHFELTRATLVALLDEPA